MLNKMKIRTKLILSFLFMAAIAAFISLFAIQKFNKINDEIAAMFVENTEPLGHLIEMTESFQKVFRNARDMILVETPEEYEIEIVEAESYNRTFDSLMVEYGKAVIDEHDKIAFNELANSKAECWNSFKKFQKIVEAGKTEEAKEMLHGELQNASDKYQSAIDYLTELNTKEAKEASEANLSMTRSSARLMFFVMILGVLIANFFGFMIARDIQSIINLVVKETDIVTTAAVEGKLTQRAAIEKVNSEFRPIAESFNKTLDTVLGYMDNIPTPAMIINTEFDILYMNEAGARIGNRTPKQLIGTKCYDHFKTSHCKTMNCACGRSMSENVTVTAETDAHPNGLNLDISYTGVPVKDREGRIAGAFEIVIDQTAVKTAERLARKIAAYQEEETRKVTGNLIKIAKGDLDVNTVIRRSGQRYKRGQREI